jgi:excisionase family DNA binding protein
MIQDLLAQRRDLVIRLADIDAEITSALIAGQQSAVPQDQDLLSAKQAAKRLGISTVYIYELARLKTIPAVRIGRAVRFRSTDISNYSTRRTTS